MSIKDVNNLFASFLFKNHCLFMKSYLQIIGVYFKNILISLDQFLNTLCGGDPDETVSSRLGKYYKDFWLYDVLDDIEKNHCETSIENDEGDNAILK